MISPEHDQTGNLDHSKFEELADQFAHQIRQGDSPEIAVYANKYPVHAEAIHRLFPVLELMERKGTPVEDFSEDGLLEAEMAQLQSTATFQKLGDYRIVREIGRGGMGIVFEAQQESLDRTVALKLLPTSAQFDARRQQRFQQEAQASAKLHHTNIVPVFGVGAHEDTAYFVMQYIDGQPLDNVLSELSKIRSGNAKRRSGPTEAIALDNVSTIASAISQVDYQSPFSSEPRAVSNEKEVSDASRSSASSIANEGVYWRNIAKIGIQVASALEHAHLRKTLHRDIKPSNLLIDRTGCAWVTDFGLAKFFESPDLTRTGEVVGTLRYMSPEQLNGKADERSDIFGLGLTLYEMAALKPAYDANDRNQLMQQALEANPRPLRTVNHQVPKDLETIIHKCIANDPQARYQTATLLVNDLERFVAGEPVLARRINPIQRAAKWCRRRPAVASLIAALLFSLFAGTLGIAWQWNKTVDALELANENLGEATRQTELATENLAEANRQTVMATENFAEAKRQKEVAQQHFQQARDSVNRFFVLVSQQRLLREPGFAPLRRELMQSALDYHKQFVTQYRDDDELRVELAQSLYHVADIEGQLNANPDIVEELEEPIAIFSDLVESNPDEPNYQLWLARCLSLKSNILRRSDVMASLETMGEANEVIEAVLAEHPGEKSAASELAKNYQMLGLSFEQIDKASGQTERSLANYTKALELRQRIHADDPGELGNTILLAELHRDLGITHRRRGEDEKAIEYYDLALDLLQPVVEQHPDNIQARTSLGSIANSIGFFYGRSNEDEELEKALTHYEVSMTQYQELANRSPQVIQYQDGLARAALNAAAVYQVQGDLGKAFQYRSDAAEIREKLCNLNPGAHHIRSSWAVSLNGVGASLRGLNRIDEAIEIHHLALEQHKRVLKTGVMQSIGRLRLIDGLSQLARAQSAGKMFEDAVVSLDAMEEFTSPTDTHPFFSQGREFAIVASKIGKLGADEIDDGLDVLKDTCIGKSKSAFSKAAERGLDVIKRAESDAVFQNFVETPECAEIKAWMIDRFGS